MKYKFLKHTADIKFRAYGKKLEEVFENSGLAMFEAMHFVNIKKVQERKIKVRGKDIENLLYVFLEELLVLLDSDDFVFSGAEIKIIHKEKGDGKFYLEGEIFGDDASNYQSGSAVKAVTYNEMFVKKIDREWVCQVVLDV